MSESIMAASSLEPFTSAVGDRADEQIVDELEVGVRRQLARCGPGAAPRASGGALVEKAVEVLAELLVHPRRGQHVGKTCSMTPVPSPSRMCAQLLEVAGNPCRDSELGPALVPRRQHQGLLGGPPPVDGRLADAGPNRDGIHREPARPVSPTRSRVASRMARSARASRPAGCGPRPRGGGPAAGAVTTAPTSTPSRAGHARDGRGAGDGQGVVLVHGVQGQHVVGPGGQERQATKTATRTTAVPSRRPADSPLMNAERAAFASARPAVPPRSLATWRAVPTESLACVTTPAGSAWPASELVSREL